LNRLEWLPPPSVLSPLSLDEIPLWLYPGAGAGARCRSGGGDHPGGRSAVFGLVSVLVGWGGWGGRCARVQGPWVGGGCPSPPFVPLLPGFLFSGRRGPCVFFGRWGGSVLYPLPSGGSEGVGMAVHVHAGVGLRVWGRVGGPLGGAITAGGGARFSGPFWVAGGVCSLGWRGLGGAGAGAAVPGAPGAFHS